jgi:hypothetical protein
MISIQPCTAVVWDCLIIGLFWLHHIQSLANVIMETIACNLLLDENNICAVMLLCQPELLFTVGLRDLKTFLAA